MTTEIPTGLEPTQTRRPWRATLRTALAVGIPALLLLPTIFDIIVEELGGNLPPQVTQYLVLIGAFVTALAAVITRILALPQVELLLRRLPAAAFAAQPRPKPEPKPADVHDDRGSASYAALVCLAIVGTIVVVYLVIGALR